LFDSELERLSRFLLTVGGRAVTIEQFQKAVEEEASLRRREALRFDKPDSAKSGHEIPSVSIALVGGPMRRWERRIFGIIEKLGGRVVLNATEPGERNLSEPGTFVAGANGSLEQLRFQLAQECVARCIDVYQRPNTRLYEWLEERLRERQPRGIVLWYYDWCDLWRAELQTMRETFGLPVLPLQADSLAGDEPRLVNRLEAFLESLR
jgi:benzoyl-CoA reductase/2-hydroxyglutaryl-CoA dehydratase subunit BcrC/BadD/HgdB